MIEGNSVKIVRGIEKVNLTPEEKEKPFFIVRDFDNKLIVTCQYIANPEMNICLYDNQFCFLLNSPPEDLMINLTRFLARKNLKIILYNFESKNLKNFIDGTYIKILEGNKVIKKDDRVCTVIRNFDDSLKISCSHYPQEINIVLYRNKQLIFSVGCGGNGNFTIDLTSFLENNNLKIVPNNDIKVPEITEGR